MKKFILTHCALEDNYTPRIFTTKEKAKKAFDELVDQLIEDAGVLLLEVKVSDCKAILNYSNDTYDAIEIFEIEEE